MKREAIYGIFGLYNYGCEAIVRGTVDFARRLYGEECPIVYYSRNYQDDKKTADELGIAIADIGRTSTFLLKCILKAVDILQIQTAPFYKKEYARIIREADIMMLVGGDLYTLPAYLRKRKRYRYVNYLVEFGNKALKAGKSVMIYGASVGPFGEYGKALSYYTDHFKKVDGIICREQVSVDYLRSLGITDNVAMLPDPAFLVMNQDHADETERTYIGMNLSAFSLRELYGFVSEEMVLKLVELLERMYLNTGRPFMFIPHVVHAAEKSDDDAVFLRRVYDKLPEYIREISVFANPVSFLDAKRYLSQCKIAVCARMHCAVNAVTVNTPALFLAYSSKAEGMSEFVYGNKKWCVPLCNAERNLVEKVAEMLEHTEVLQNRIADCRQRVLEQYETYIQEYRDDGQWLN